MELDLLTETYAVYRFAPGAEPSLAAAAYEFTSVTRTADELSVVCPEGAVTGADKEEAGWKAFKVRGPLDFGLVGVLSTLTGALAAAGVSLFALSTFDTDYVLVKADNVGKAVRALLAAGCVVNTQGSGA